MQTTTDMAITESNTEPKEPPQLEDCYFVRREIGKGSFSSVHVGVHKTLFERRAIKLIHKENLQPNEQKELSHEVEILGSLKHPNIVELIDVFDSEKSCALVMELLYGGELVDAVGQEGLPEPEAAMILRDIADALLYMHIQGIVHRDVKLENVMFTLPDRPCPVKLIDFGLATRLDPSQPLTSQVGSPDYCAPEILKGGPYGIEVDIWSLGVLLYAMLSGCLPFEHTNGSRMVEKILAGKFEFCEEEGWNKISASAKDLISHLLVVDPASRYTIQQVLMHPWLESLGNAGERTLMLKQKFQSMKNLYETKKQEIGTSGKTILSQSIANLTQVKQEYNTLAISLKGKLSKLKINSDNNILKRKSASEPPSPSELSRSPSPTPTPLSSSASVETEQQQLERMYRTLLDDSWEDEIVTKKKNQLKKPLPPVPQIHIVPPQRHQDLIEF